MAFISLIWKWKRSFYFKNATTELYKNLSYMTLSGGRELEFQAVSDFIGQLSFIIKS